MSNEKASIKHVMEWLKADADDPTLNADASLKILATYFSNQITDLQQMMTALMLQVENLSASVEAASSTQNSLDSLRTACRLMAAKVDNAATPVTSFVATFNNNI